MEYDIYFFTNHSDDAEAFAYAKSKFLPSKNDRILVGNNYYYNQEGVAETNHFKVYGVELVFGEFDDGETYDDNFHYVAVYVHPADEYTAY